MEVPAIVDPEEFEAVQKHLKRRRPTERAARLSNGAKLLTGLAQCPNCGGGMTITTGKSGRYRYYTCSTSMTKGRSACAGRRIPMDTLDHLVLTAITERLTRPKHLQQLLSGLAKRIIERQGRGAEQERELKREQRQIETRIDKLYDALESGQVDDSDSFRIRATRSGTSCIKTIVLTRSNSKVSIVRSFGA